MAAKENFSVEKVSQVRDVYLRGELIRVSPGQVVLTEPNGSIEILDESDYEAKYESGGDSPDSEAAAQPDVVQEPLVATLSKEETLAIASDPEAEVPEDTEFSPDVELTKELNDKKTLVGAPGVPVEDEHFPPAPTEPVEERDPRDPDDAPIKQDDIKGV